MIPYHAARLSDQGLQKGPFASLSPQRKGQPTILARQFDRDMMQLASEVARLFPLKS
jgi:hypothetical protein